MNSKYGFVISILIHALFFTIPVSVAVQEKVNDIELFFILEDAHKSIRPVEKITHIPCDVKKADPKPKIIEEVKQPEETPVQEDDIAEPVERLRAETLQTGSEISRPLETRTTSTIQTATVPDSSEPIDTEFGSVIAPSFLHREMPAYPIFARRIGKEGRVVLRLTIDKKGDLLDVEVVERAGYGFTEAAIAAVKKSTFRPAKKNGNPVASRALLPVRFTLRR
ncbi:MAG: energy transducer TonB [Nitrospirae bacterium]|jgi:periplasmic protein TonB|nr:energy transducer TonB [Nitrospirota bacterium]